MEWCMLGYWACHVDLQLFWDITYPLWWNEFLLLNSGCGVKCVWHAPIEGTRCAAWRVLVFLNRNSLAGGNAAVPFHFVTCPSVVQIGTKLFMEMSTVCYQLYPVLHEFSYSLNETCRWICFNMFASFSCVELEHHEISLMHDTSCTSTCCVCVRACEWVSEWVSEWERNPHGLCIWA
jgi:hypothetical protein